MKKLVIGTSLILATLAATPSFAATHHSRATQSYAAAYAAGDTGLVTNGPAIYENGVYAGWDPDPAIRLQLMRDQSLEGN